jgi:uncharacterized protein
VSPATIEREIRQWLTLMVIGENLCPFAAEPYDAGRVRVAVCAAQDDDGIYRAFLEQLQQLLSSDPRQLETTLLVCPDGLGDFAHYLDLLAHLEATLRDDLDLAGVMQIASFHPDYCFAGAAPNDLANYTNRSPYPLFHLLREESVSAAVQQAPHPERIPERNKQHLRRLGLTRIRQLLREEG